MIDGGKVRIKGSETNRGGRIWDTHIKKGSHGAILTMSSTKRGCMKAMCCLELMTSGLFVKFPTRNTRSMAKAGYRMPRQTNGLQGELFSVMKMVATCPLGIFNSITFRSEIYEFRGTISHVRGRPARLHLPLLKKEAEVP